MKKIKNPFVHLDGYDCFGCAPENPLGVKMEFWEDGDEILSHWQPAPHYQGWLHTLHGGIQSVLLDEICGWTVMRKLQTGGVTSRMETRYLRPVRTDGGPLTLRAHIVSQRRNLVEIEATLANEAGEVCTRALCQYFTLPPEKARTELHFEGCGVEE